MPEGFTVAYIMSRFPKLTETFVLYEILAVETQGVRVELFPLMREHTQTMHTEARPLVERAQFTPFISPAIVLSNLRALITQPRAYLGALATSLRATWGSLRYLGGILVFFPKAVHMARLMKQQNVRHIHAHFASHPAAAAFIIHRLAGIPYSFTAHGSDLHRDQHMLCEKVREAAFTVTISGYNAQIIRDRCGAAAHDVVVVRSGVDTGVFQAAEQVSTDGPLKILCIGSLHEVKGQTHLIEACRLLRERGVAFECNLIGGGEDRDKLEQQVAAANLGDVVHFRGQVPRSEVLAALQSADVLVTPSVPSQDGRREGIPVVIMEAMASGLPVVASRLSGIPELVDDGINGVLIEPGDSQGIAEALAALAQDSDRRHQYGGAGREKVIQSFDLHQNAARLVRMFGGEKA